MRKTAVNIARLILAVVLILSGFVKAVDPLGTQYKIDDYLLAMNMGGVVPSIVTLVASVALSAMEFSLGIFLLFAIRRRLVSRVVVVMMGIMTLLTLWLALANPISDCGCFGDAIVLTNWQTLLKNVVLLTAAIIVARWPLEMFRFVSRSNQWIVINYTILFIIGISAWSLYYLPQFDFRPYHIGASIREGMEMPEGAEQPQFETTFILEKNGERREFTLDNYPDSTWTFIDSRTVQTSEGFVPPIHDFSIVLCGETPEHQETPELSETLERLETPEYQESQEYQEDITEEVLSDTSYTFLLVAPYLDKADDSRLDLINELYEYSLEHGYRFYCLTASAKSQQDMWREMTGADYPFCQTDDVTLKTIIRSNPGMVLLKDGRVIRKWSHNDLPQLDSEQFTLPLHRLEIGQMPEDSVPGKIVKLLLWFVLPLALLTIADRLWMWTRWVRRNEKPSEEQERNEKPATSEEQERNEKPATSEEQERNEKPATSEEQEKE